MLIEAAKGGHTNVVNLLLDYPNSILSPSPDLQQLASTESQLDANEVSTIYVTKRIVHSVWNKASPSMTTEVHSARLVSKSVRQIVW